MKFEWDDAKRRANMKKHGIDFEDVLTLFADADALIERDDRRDYGEPRYNLMGRRENIVLLVTFTRRQNCIRLISARKAHRKERARYDKRQN